MIELEEPGREKKKEVFDILEYRERSSLKRIWLMVSPTVSNQSRFNNYKCWILQFRAPLFSL